MSAPQTGISTHQQHYLPVSDPSPPTGAQIKVTFYGISTLLFDDGRTQILIDAFLTRPTRQTLLTSLATGEKSIASDPGVVEAWLARPEVRSVAAVFVAHSHHDHALDVAEIARRTGAQVHGSPSTLNIARGGGVPEAQLHRYRLWEPVTVGEFTVTVLPGRHPQNPPPLTDDRDLTIDAPLAQPAAFADFVEGGSFAFLIEHHGRRILVQVPSYVVGVLDDVRADVMFLSVIPIGHVDRRHTDTFYDQTIGNVRPRLVVPVHWDDFMEPAAPGLVPLGDEIPAKFDDLLERLERDNIAFGIMQGMQTVTLFQDDTLVRG
ncbi:MBL fold metallo-hydrolase [Kitasatospora paranensis]|uniref:MBL fold metallo-hydrolase n=2 Tax=Kitasatospora paranensis TaxID=258053 RepID=A0ABW2G1R9_9ACTN